MNLSKLNTQQREAVETIDYPLLILAGAGSGKTNVLVHRIAYLIENHHASPFEILAITFTNKAANEMKDRIIGMIGEKGKYIWAKTFHSACLQILRENIDMIDYDKDFVIYDGSDQISIIKGILQQLNIDPDLFKPSYLHAEISDIKNKSWDFYKAIEELPREDYPEQIIDIMRRYQETLKENNAMDFDDIICTTVMLLKNNLHVAQKYQSRFKYIMVDEYQDTNHIQYELISALENEDTNLCVVGDDDQSIYEWRGADITNILNFENDHPQTKVIKLEENYRSTQNILDLANSIIANNAIRKRKSLWTSKGAGENIIYYEADDDRDEGYFIGRQIKKFVDQTGFDYQQIAVLIRTTAQFRSIEESFLKQQIPYKIYGGIKFYQRKEIKDILAFLTILVNPNDRLNLKRVINIPKRGIGDKTWQKIIDFHHANSHMTLLDCLVDDSLPLSKKIMSSLKEFYFFIEKAKDISLDNTLVETLDYIMNESGYKSYIFEKDALSSDIVWDNINEFFSVAADFDMRDVPTEEKTLSVFLEEISLFTDLDQDNDHISAVNIMTMHSSKGLEFPVVFVAGFEENLFPHIRSTSENGLEEERRLCYVAFTRAMEYLVITRAKQRLVHGRFLSNGPSQFFYEMRQDLLNNTKKQGVLRSNVFNKTTPVITDEKTTYALGDKIKHRSWGIGIVVAVSDKEENLITVAFPNEGIKKIMTDYAPIEKMVEK